jgi:hypothetical protein
MLHTPDHILKGTGANIYERTVQSGALRLVNIKRIGETKRICDLFNRRLVV